MQVPAQAQNANGQIKTHQFHETVLPNEATIQAHMPSEAPVGTELPCMLKVGEAHQVTPNDIQLMASSPSNNFVSSNQISSRDRAIYTNQRDSFLDSAFEVALDVMLERFSSSRESLEIQQCRSFFFEGQQKTFNSSHIPPLSAETLVTVSNVETSGPDAHLRADLHQNLPLSAQLCFECLRRMSLPVFPAERLEQLFQFATNPDSATRCSNLRSALASPLQSSPVDIRGRYLFAQFVALLWRVSLSHPSNTLEADPQPPNFVCTAWVAAAMIPTCQADSDDGPPPVPDAVSLHKARTVLRALVLDEPRIFHTPDDAASPAQAVPQRIPSVPITPQPQGTGMKDTNDLLGELLPRLPSLQAFSDGDSAVQHPVQLPTITSGGGGGGAFSLSALLPGRSPRRVAAVNEDDDDSATPVPRSPPPSPKQLSARALAVTNGAAEPPRPPAPALIPAIKTSHALPAVATAAMETPPKATASGPTLPLDAANATGISTRDGVGAVKPLMLAVQPPTLPAPAPSGAAANRSGGCGWLCLPRMLRGCRPASYRTVEARVRSFHEWGEEVTPRVPAFAAAGFYLAEAAGPAAPERVLSLQAFCCEASLSVRSSDLAAPLPTPVGFMPLSSSFGSRHTSTGGTYGMPLGGDMVSAAQRGAGWAELSPEGAAVAADALRDHLDQCPGCRWACIVSLDVNMPPPSPMRLAPLMSPREVADLEASGGGRRSHLRWGEHK